MRRLLDGADAVAIKRDDFPFPSFAVTAEEAGEGGTVDELTPALEATKATVANSSGIFWPSVTVTRVPRRWPTISIGSTRAKSLKIWKLGVMEMS
jgi:hypothetical protein